MSTLDFNHIDKIKLLNFFQKLLGIDSMRSMIRNTVLKEEEILDKFINMPEINDLISDKKLADFIDELNEDEYRNLFTQLENNLFLKDLKWLANDKSSFRNKILLSKVFFQNVKDNLIKPDNKNSKSKFEKLKSEKIYTSDLRFFELLSYQTTIKETALSVLRDKILLPRMLIHMPTGTGKTKTSMHILVQHYLFDLKKKGVIVWLAHTNELLNQAINTFKNVWHHLGDKPIDLRNNDTELILSESQIIFLSYQKLISLSKKKNLEFKELSDNTVMIFCDEAHKCLAKETNIAIENLMRLNDISKNKVLIGLTATPGRKINELDDDEENEALSNMFERRILTINLNAVKQMTYQNEYTTLDDKYDKDSNIIKYFQENKILSHIDRIAIHNKDFIDSKEIDDKDYITISSELLKTLSIDNNRNELIINKLIDLDIQKTPTIVFSCSVQHGIILELILKLNGIKAEGVYGKDDIAQRSQKIEKFNSGEYNILINYDVLSTGFDSPRIECVFITRPTRSIIQYSQMLGRGLRGEMMGGNQKCLLIDLIDNNELFNPETMAFNYFEEYWK
jgi:superfamily II DNA or RNA helicase